MGNKLRKVAEGYRGEGNEAYTFRCPGCKDVHYVSVKRGARAGAGPTWSFNGSLERPTFQPSLLVRCGCKAPGYKPGESCWCTHNAEAVAKGEAPAPFQCGTCHSFITDGAIQFLSDCTHELAGKTVAMEDVE